MKRGTAGLATIALLFGGLGLAGFGLAAGAAQAEPGFAPQYHGPVFAGGPYQWCPGQDKGGFGGAFNTPGPPNWDWGVCHTYYVVQDGQGNVSPSIWEGDNPPAPRTPGCAPGCL